MTQFQFISILLLAPVIFDAIGDALRLKGKQILHHIMEVFHVAAWIVIWATFPFDWLFIIMYVLGRIVIFDVIFNIIADLPIGYVGENSLYDRFLRLFGGWVKQHPGHFAFIFRVMALVAWIGLYLKWAMLNLT